MLFLAKKNYNSQYSFLDPLPKEGDRTCFDLKLLVAKVACLKKEPIGCRITSVLKCPHVYPQNSSRPKMCYVVCIFPFRKRLFARTGLANKIPAPLHYPLLPDKDEKFIIYYLEYFSENSKIRCKKTETFEKD